MRKGFRTASSVHAYYNQLNRVFSVTFLKPQSSLNPAAYQLHRVGFSMAKCLLSLLSQNEEVVPLHLPFVFTPTQ